MNILKLISFMKPVGIDPDAQAFISASGITNITEKNAIIQLVKDLKDNGLWTKMYAIYPMVGGTTTSCSYNLINPSAYQMSFSGSWTVDGSGILPNSVGSSTIYADTGFNLSTNLTSKDNVSVGVYCDNFTNNIGTPCGEIGVSNGNFLSGIGVLTAENNSGYFVSNSGSNFIQYTNTSTYTSGTYNNGTYYVTGSGFYITSRSNSATFDSFVRGNDYKNFSLASTSQTMPNKTIYVGALNPDGSFYSFCGSTNKKISFAFIGTGLSSSDVDLYFECVQRFNTALSRYIGIPYYDIYDSDAQAYIMAAGLTSFFDKSVANYLVSELKAHSLWTKMIAVYPYLGTSITAQGYNLKNTASYNLSYTTAGGITANSEGLQIVQGASFEYADTGINDNTLTASNVHIAHSYKNTNYPTGYHIGIYSLSAGGGTFIGPNAGIFQSGGASRVGPSRPGFNLIQKASSGILDLYRNGSLNSSVTAADAAATGFTLLVGGLNDYGQASQPQGRSYGVFNYTSIGTGLSSGENSTYYSIVKTAMRSLGRSSN